MKFSVSLVSLVFNIFIATFSVVLVEAQNKKIHHDFLIKSIHDIYGTAGIIIATDEPSQRAMKRLTIGYETCRMLSNEGIPSIVVNFKKFKERLLFYSNQMVHPLVVIALGSREEVHIFEKIAKDLTIGYLAIWLILFLAHNDHDICEYCRNPSGNVLNLRFDSQVLVLCCESSIIEEWWSPTVNRTRRQPIGRWFNEDDRFERFTNATVYIRRNSLEGRKLRIAAAKGSAYIWEENGTYRGFFGEILNELSQSMNFTVTKLIWEDGFGIFDPKTSNWSGLIGKIQRNEADIGVSPFCMTAQRLDAIDFTIPMEVGESLLYMKKLHGARIQWKAYVKAFATDVWMVIIGLILIMPLFLTLIRYKKRSHFLPLLIEHYLCVWGIYCQQGLSKFPKETTLRIVYVSIFISALVSASVYSASLVSFLTVFSSYSSFNTIQEFARDGTYKLIVLKDSSLYYTYKTSNDTFRRQMMSLMKPRDSLPYTLVGGFNQVCHERVAFETNEAIRKTMGHSIFCDITSMATGTIETFGMITPRQSEYLAFINYRIRQFKYNGMFKRLENKYFRERFENKLNYPKVHVEGIEPILYTLAGGYLITLIIFIIELVFNLLGNILRQWKIRRLIEKEIDYSRFRRNIP